MRRSFLVLVLALVVGSLLYTPAVAGQKVLKAVSFLPKNHMLCSQIHVWVKQVNDACKGDLKINWVGGPEVIPPFEQAEALRKGVIQVGFLPAAYYKALLPEADAISLSRMNFAEERKPGGLWEYMVRRHKKINMRVMGTWLYDPFYLYVNKPVKGLSDLKGVRMRTAAKYDKMMKKLGIVPITVQFGETYTALQRGLVDGFGWPTLGPRRWGWVDFCKYVIDIPFYSRQNTFMIFNLNTWNSLPADAKKMIEDVTLKFEPNMKIFFEKKIAEEKQSMAKIGVKRIKFSPADTKLFLKAASDAVWEELEEKVPDQVPILKKLMGY
ncbi:MAG: TRAP transporter substrate-binding protein DctP [Deltaproteobacteria bacterium]|nr:TRAP transporter substrate-binding protein DctP [Deltaproteobacteria bacterium]